jgi:hypothetical protein
MEILSVLACGPATHSMASSVCQTKKSLFLVGQKECGPAFLFDKEPVFPYNGQFQARSAPR